MAIYGGPAFPSRWHPVVDGYERDDCGMSLRDYFAAQALIGWLADGAIARIMVGHQVDDAGALKILADGCYRAADAMLKAREE